MNQQIKHFLKRILSSLLCFSILCSSFPSPGRAQPTLEDLFGEEETFVRDLRRVLRAEPDERFWLLNSPLLSIDHPLRSTIERDPEDLLCGPDRDNFMGAQFHSPEAGLSHPALAALQTLITGLQNDRLGRVKKLAEWYKTFAQALVSSPPKERARLLRPKAYLFLERGDPLRLDKELALSLLEREEHGLTRTARVGQTHHCIPYPPLEEAGEEPAAAAASAAVDDIPYKDHRFYFKNCQSSNLETFVPIGNEAAVYGLSHFLWGRGVNPSLFGILKLSLLDTVNPSDDEAQTIQAHLNEALRQGQTSQAFFAQHPDYRAKLSRSSPRFFPLQISREIQGKTLGEALSQGDSLNQRSYEEMFLLSLLTGPGGWKGKNLVVTPEGQIVAIDNSKSFCPGLYEKEGTAHLGVKNVLYTLQRRDLPFDSETRESFRKVNPELLLLLWTSYLRSRQLRWDNLKSWGVFPDEFYGETGAQLPLHLPSHSVSEIYERLLALHTIFRDRERVSGAVLLEQLDQQVWDIYRGFSSSLEENERRLYAFEKTSSDRLPDQTDSEAHKFGLPELQRDLEKRLKKRWEEDQETFLPSLLTHYRQLWQGKERLPSTFPFLCNLRRLLPPLGFHLALEHLFPAAENGVRSFGEGCLPVEGALAGRRFIPPEIRAVFLDENGNLKRMNDLVRYNLASIRDPIFQQPFYCLTYPQFPGIEMHITILIRRLIGDAPYSDLFKIAGKPVLVIQGSEGVPLSSDHLARLNLEALYDRILMEMLLNPANGSPKNYYVEEFTGLTLRSVSHEHPFVPAVAKAPFEEIVGAEKRKVYVQVRSFLFTLGAMGKTIPEDIRLRWAHNLTNPQNILETWLEGLRKLSARFEALFDEEESVRFLKTEGSCLRIPFSPELFGMLYTKMVRMQRHLARGPCTALDLLHFIEPALANRYEPILGRTDLEPKKRFQEIEGTHCGPQGQTLSTTKLLLRAWGLCDAKTPLYPLIRQMSSTGIAAALRAIDAIQSPQLGKNTEIPTLLQRPSVEIEDFLEKWGIQHWTRLQEESFLKGEKKVGLLGKEDIRTVLLRGSKALNTSLLNRAAEIYNWSVTNRWVHVDLSEAQEIDHAALEVLCTSCLYLSHLVLQNMPSLERVSYPSGTLGDQTLEFPLEWPSLQVLDLKGSSKLASICLKAPHLWKLVVAGCVALQDIEKLSLTAPQLKHVDYEWEFKGIKHKVPPELMGKSDHKKLWTRALRGEASAQYNLGVLYDNGCKIPRDYGKAQDWYEQAAAQGHIEAQNNLGALYYEGCGMAPDYATAGKWYEKAAALGSPYAQLNLAILSALGRGMEKDVSRAKELLLSSNQGNAFYVLGVLWDQEGNSAKAEQFYQQALERMAQAKDKAIFIFGFPLRGELLKKFCTFLHPLTERLGVIEAGLTNQDLNLLLSKPLKQLTDLNLEKNQLSDEGMERLASVLPHWPTLTTLSLRDNPEITDKGADSLAAALRDHPNLVSLNMQQTGLTEGGKARLREAVQGWSSLFSLVLD